MPSAPHLKTGKLGEDITVRFLQGKGFEVIECNYWRKWGELDIVAGKRGVVHFVEVKATACHVSNDFDPERDSTVRPEEHMHKNKQDRLKRAIQTYLAEHPEITKWVFDVALVYVDREAKRAGVKMMENVIL